MISDSIPISSITSVCADRILCLASSNCSSNRKYLFNSSTVNLPSLIPDRTRLLTRSDQFLEQNSEEQEVLLV
jgi:hypothetical protein